MDQHQKLRVLVRVDIDPHVATVQVGGCLTEASCERLLPILERAGSLASESDVTVDLSAVLHLDHAAIVRINDSGLATRILPPTMAPERTDQQCPACTGRAACTMSP